MLVEFTTSKQVAVVFLEAGPVSMVLDIPTIQILRERKIYSLEALPQEGQCVQPAWNEPLKQCRESAATEITEFLPVGKTQHFLQTWEQLTQDSWILQMVQGGKIPSWKVPHFCYKITTANLILSIRNWIYPCGQCQEFPPQSRNFETGNEGSSCSLGRKTLSQHTPAAGESGNSGAADIDAALFVPLWGQF